MAHFREVPTAVVLPMSIDGNTEIAALLGRVTENWTETANLSALGYQTSMTNAVYGYAEARSEELVGALQHRLKICAEEATIGLVEIQASGVYGLPIHLMPRKHCTCFRIVDRPGAANSTYLVDMIDYAPDSRIRLPHSGLARLERLINWVVTVARAPETQALVIAASDANEVEGSVILELCDVRSRLIEDFIEYAPPNKVYVIRQG